MSTTLPTERRRVRPALVALSGLLLVPATALFVLSITIVWDLVTGGLPLAPDLADGPTRTAIWSFLVLSIGSVALAGAPLATGVRSRPAGRGWLTLATGVILLAATLFVGLFALAPYGD